MKTIFVSSTFRDMQAERDMLHLDVMPALQQKAREYGEGIDFIDLRWGVNTGGLQEDEANHKVLQVCLDNIDRAKPYMLIFLGERYGWMPPPELLNSAADAKGYQRKIFEESVTALEIEYGALAQEQLDRCVVCIREPLPTQLMDERSRADYEAESPYHKQKLDHLKEELADRLGDRVIYYRAGWDERRRRLCGLEELATALTHRLLETLEPDWQKQAAVSWQEAEMLQSGLFFADKCRRFAGREALIRQYEEDILTKSGGVFVLEGEAGSGKSSVAAVLMERLIHKGYGVVPFACGYSGRSTTAEDFVKQAVWYLEQQLEVIEPFAEERIDPLSGNRHPQPVEAWQAYFTKLCEQYQGSDLPPVFYVLDALEQLTQTKALHTFSFLPDHVGGKIRFIFTCQAGYTIPLLTGVDTLIKNQLPLLQDGSQAREVLEGMLKDTHKGLDDEVWGALLEKPSINNPLYASMLLWRLMIMDGDDLANAKTADAMNQKMIDIITSCSQNLSGLCREVTAEAADRIGAVFVGAVLPLIAVSRQGLRTKDLERAFTQLGIEWSGLDFARMQRYLAPFMLWRADGRLDFAHRSIREGFLEGIEDIAYWHGIIRDGLRTLPTDDQLRRLEGLYHGRLSEDGEFCLVLLADVWPCVVDMTQFQVAVQAANGLLEICEADQGDWLCNTLIKYGHKPFYCRAAAFLGGVFSGGMLQNSPERIRLGIKVLETALKAFVPSANPNEEEQLLVPVLSERLGTCYLWDDQPDRAAYWLSKSLGAFEGVYAQAPTSLNRANYIASAYSLAKLWLKQEDYSKAYQKLLPIQALCEEEFHEEETVQSLGRLGSVSLLLARACLGLKYYQVGIIAGQKAVEFLELYLKLSNDMVNLHLIIQGRNIVYELLEESGNIDEAITTLTQLVEDLERLSRHLPDMQTTKQLVDRLTLLADSLFKRKRPQGAAVAMQRACTLRKAIFDAEPTLGNIEKLAVVYYLTGLMLVETGSLQNAVEMIEEAVACTAALYQHTNGQEDWQRHQKYAETLSQIRGLLEEEPKPQSDNTPNDNSNQTKQEGEYDMENTSKMLAQKTFDTFCQMLDKKEWNYKTDAEKFYIQTGVRGDDLPISLRIAVDPNTSLVRLYSNLDFTVPDDKIGETAVAICIINDNMIDGNFDLDVTEGSICYRLSLSFRESLISEAALDFFLGYAVYMIDEYNDKLLMLVKGKLTPQELLQSILEE